MSNALIHESSPYLRQHADNPVDWLPWGPEALDRARERNVPLLVSIGYSSCHWCHVMERESFEDEHTARLMNERFVCVKVDREERPDVDALYMEAVQGMTGHGGWPLNVFLTPTGLPFYGGTYFPPQERPGMPAFSQVLVAVAEAWSERGEEIAASSEQLRERLSGGALLRATEESFDQATLDAAVERLRGSFDAVNGGFGGAPKFPQASVIEFLMCRAGGDREGPSSPAPNKPSPTGARAAEMALYTLRSMAGGGIHDQIGGGFHRYAVDSTWTVPHFEKMLYDNALLARAYLHGAQLSGDARLLEVCHDALRWALREMRGPEGGFYSALDADSDGVEGSFYVWTTAELQSVLDADSEVAIRWLGATEQGNFVDPHHPQPGLNVLEDRGTAPDAQTRARIRARLLEVRGQRVRPGLDDKRLTSWNALMICALAEAGSYLGGAPVATLGTDTPTAFLGTDTPSAFLGTDSPSAFLGTDSPTAFLGTDTPTAFLGTDALTAFLGATTPGAFLSADTPGTFLSAAIECAEFVLRDLRDSDGRLLRTYSNGEAKIDAYLEDHAFLLEALIALFEATCDERWLTDAIAVANELIARFSDPENGGFFSTAADSEQLIARRKELEDSPIPAGGSSAAMGLLRLAQLTGDEQYAQQSARTTKLLQTIAPKHPTAFGHMLQAMHWQLAPPRPIACELPARRD
ncbi:MAG: thioredoxin domain-containing protein [Solirubrobacteraceae bacterium]